MKSLASPLAVKCEATTGGNELPESSSNMAAASSSTTSAGNKEERVIKFITPGVKPGIKYYLSARVFLLRLYAPLLAPSISS